MGSVLLFRPRSAAVRRERLPAGTSASIVIFPGVRYERENPAAPCAMTVELLRGVEPRQELPAPRR